MIEANVDVLLLTRASLKRKLAQECKRLRHHIDGSASSMRHIEDLQALIGGLDGLEEIKAEEQQQALAYARL